MQKVFLKKSQSSERLDKFVTSKISDISRSQIQKLIKAGKVFVNKEKIQKNGYSISFKDEVVVELEGEGSEETGIMPQNIDLQIIYKDENLIVLNKQSGIVVHPGAGVPDGTVLNALRYHFPEITSLDDDQNFGLINRLDKGTSGILLVARNKKALWGYSKQFENRLVKKAYLTIVRGDWSKKYPSKKSMLISNYLGRNSRDRTKRAIVPASRGRIATSKVYFIKSRTVKKEVFSLLMVQIMTGRTHQIRVHLSDLGFSVLGDKKYGKADDRRLMLHSYFTKIKDLSGRSKEFLAPIPQEFGEFFNLDTNSSKIKSLLDNIKANK